MLLLEDYNHIYVAARAIYIMVGIEKMKIEIVLLEFFPKSWWRIG
jgi:hypothetical protein